MRTLSEFKQRVRLAWIILKNSDGNTLKHAEREFAEVWPHCDEMQDLVKENLRDLLRVLASQGHSGFSVNYVLSCFDLLARFKPIGPLTGSSTEWVEVYEDEGKPVYQNKRCGEVFMRDGQAYNSVGVVFEEPNGCRFTSFYSRVPVTFPYSPRSVVVKVPFEATEEEKKVAAKTAIDAI